MTFQRELKTLEESIRIAGDAVQRIARDGFETRDKGGDDPVTTADLECDRILREALIGAFPDDGWLSEETVDTPGRLDCRRVWIVDPIDGTREFVQQIPEYGISVALVEDGQPVVAAVLNPATGELCSAVRGQGVQTDGSPTRVAEFDGTLRLVSSRSEVKKGEFDRFADDAEITVTGSIAYKLALVAMGRADGVVSMWGKNEWDIAAGCLLVAEAGGRVSERDGRPFVFNQENPLREGIIAASPAAYDRIIELLSQDGSPTP